MKKTKNNYDDNDVSRVLRHDGVGRVVLGKEYENQPTINLYDIKNKMGNSSWAVRVVYNEIFGGVLICQYPGEGNRLHYHADADECWVIMEGEWEWFIDGIGTRTVKKDDIVVVRKGTKHLIKCVGTKPGIRFAVTKPDVNHTYAGGRDEK
jgi:mannose-6-phosphate isomerase-like protein (cupin superfamily)